jgi:tetratricopeptide (TPR) repeat protein
MAFLVRLIFFGFSFGEAAYSCQNSLSWQTTVVGDPLYRPFGRTPVERHEDLLRRKSKLVEWSHLRLVNINLANGLPPEKLIEYLEATPNTSTSAVLLEKLADLHFLKARWAEAVPIYRAALAQKPSPQQQVRLTLSLARAYEFSTQPERALEVFQNFLSTFPDYPDPANIYRKLTPLAAQLGKAELKEEYQRQLDKLTAAANATKP